MLDGFKWNIFAQLALLTPRQLTGCVSMNVSLDHLANKVSEGRIRRAGVIVCVAVTPAAINKQSPSFTGLN